MFAAVEAINNEPAGNQKQLDSIDEQIAKELAKQTDKTEESKVNNIYEKNQTVTKHELNNKKMAE